MRLFLISILLIVLMACSSEQEEAYEQQIEQLTTQVEQQQEQIETLQNQLEEKTREEQQNHQQENEREEENATDESDGETRESTDSISVIETEHFQLHTPQSQDVLSDMISIQGLIHLGAIGDIELEVLDSAGETIENTLIDQEWFGGQSGEHEWTGIELNMTITEEPNQGEGQLIIRDHLANEEESITIVFD
ncbi:hypothetical protein [Alkalibacillus silvisoli]|uniref:Bacterial spore germination immunoglobulin-like domain-containing protein n=1 Tax=Alkalibacillus silvisoli TaxID=392823 RepID=A0ABP3JHJ6_9BACI